MKILGIWALALVVGFIAMAYLWMPSRPPMQMDNGGTGWIGAIFVAAVWTTIGLFVLAILERLFKVKKRGYQERAQSQALSWAMGTPYHNKIDDECCPDFSCCQAELFETDRIKRWQLYHQKLAAIKS